MDKMTILIIEDNEKNLKLVRALLIMGKYRVLESLTAEEGLDMAREHTPDMILMDIQLPGMNGLEATRIIKANPDLKQIPVVALTSHAMSGDEKKAIEAGCDGYMTKPIDTRTFLNDIARYIGNEEPRTSVVKGAAIKETFRGAKILIVDDDPVNVKLIKGILARGGYKLFVAASGEQALEIVKEHQPDLILLDIMMPGIDGYEVTRQVRANPESDQIPIILVTALDSDTDKIKGKDAGAEEFLTKPVNPMEVETRVISMLKLKRYRDQLDIRSQSQGHVVDLSPKDESQDPKENTTGQILVVEDNVKDRKLLLNDLGELAQHVTVAVDGRQALEKLTEDSFDLAIVDVLLPEIDGFQICKHVKTNDEIKDTQMLLVSCLSDTENKIRAVEIGTDDYLIKPYNAQELQVRVRALLKKKQYLDKLKSQYESALNSAMMDGLTRLYNHIYFKRFLTLEILRSQRQGHQTSLLIIDIDDFKQVNDTLGHAAGDAILKAFGDLLKKTIREIDVAARYGGDEFVVVLPYGDRQALTEVGNRVCQATEQMSLPEQFEKSIPHATVSLGGAVFPDDAKTMDDLIEAADYMLYKAKRSGKNQVCIKPEAK